MVTGDLAGDTKKLPRAAPNQLSPIPDHTEQLAGDTRSMKSSLGATPSSPKPTAAELPPSTALNCTPATSGTHNSHQLLQRKPQIQDLELEELQPPNKKTLDFQNENPPQSDNNHTKLMLGACLALQDETLPSINCLEKHPQQKTPYSIKISGNSMIFASPIVTPKPLSVETVEATLTRRLGEGSLGTFQRLRKEQLVLEQLLKEASIQATEAMGISMVDIDDQLCSPTVQINSGIASPDVSQRLDVEKQEAVARVSRSPTDAILPDAHKGNGLEAATSRGHGVVAGQTNHSSSWAAMLSKKAVLKFWSM